MNHNTPHSVRTFLRVFFFFPARLERRGSDARRIAVPGASCPDHVGAAADAFAIGQIQGDDTGSILCHVPLGLDGLHELVEERGNAVPIAVPISIPTSMSRVLPSLANSVMMASEALMRPVRQDRAGWAGTGTSGGGTGAGGGGGGAGAGGAGLKPGG